MKSLIALITLVSSLTLTAQAQTTASTAADETAVRSLIDNFSKAFNAHDVKAFGATFAEDANFTNWRGSSAHGRGNIEEFHVPVLTVVYKNGVQKITDSQVRFLRPDLATVDVRAEVTGGVLPDGTAPPLMKFLVNWTVTKEPNGQWLIKVMHNTRLPDMDTPPTSRK